MGISGHAGACRAQTRTLSTDIGGCSPCICFAPTGSNFLAWTVSAVSVTCDSDAADVGSHLFAFLPIEAKVQATVAADSVRLCDRHNCIAGFHRNRPERHAEGQGCEAPVQAPIQPYAAGSLTWGHSATMRMPLALSWPSIDRTKWTSAALAPA